LRLQADCWALLAHANSYLAHAFVVLAAACHGEAAGGLIGDPAAAAAAVAGVAEVVDVVVDKEHLVHVACGVVAGLGETLTKLLVAWVDDPLEAQGPTQALRLAVRGGAGALRLVLERVRAVLCRGGAGAGAGAGVGVGVGNGEHPVDAVRPGQGQGQGPAAVGARFGTVPLLALPSDD